MTTHPKSRKSKPLRKRHIVNYIVWAMNGQPIPEGTIRKLDDAMQRVMDESHVRLAATILKEEAHG